MIVKSPRTFVASSTGQSLELWPHSPSVQSLVSWRRVPWLVSAGHFPLCWSVEHIGQCPGLALVTTGQMPPHPSLVGHWPPVSPHGHFAQLAMVQFCTQRRVRWQAVNIYLTLWHSLYNLYLNVSSLLFPEKIPVHRRYLPCFVNIFVDIFCEGLCDSIDLNDDS